MNCPNCEKELKNGKYICRLSDYRIEDTDENLVFVVSTHEIPSTDDEIDSSTDILYCVCTYWKSIN